MSNNERPYRHVTTATGGVVCIHDTDAPIPARLLPLSSTREGSLTALQQELQETLGCLQHEVRLIEKQLRACQELAADYAEQAAPPT